MKKLSKNSMMNQRKKINNVKKILKIYKMNIKDKKCLAQELVIKVKNQIIASLIILLT